MGKRSCSLLQPPIFVKQEVFSAKTRLRSDIGAEAETSIITPLGYPGGVMLIRFMQIG